MAAIAGTAKFDLILRAQRGDGRETKVGEIEVDVPTMLGSLASPDEAAST